MQCKAKQSHAKQCKGVQNKTRQSHAKQCKAMQKHSKHHARGSIIQSQLKHLSCHISIRCPLSMIPPLKMLPNVIFKSKCLEFVRSLWCEWTLAYRAKPCLNSLVQFCCQKIYRTIRKSMPRLCSLEALAIIPKTDCSLSLLARPCWTHVHLYQGIFVKPQNIRGVLDGIICQV